MFCSQRLHRLQLDHDALFDNEVGEKPPDHRAAEEHLDRLFTHHAETGVAEHAPQGSLIDRLEEALTELIVHLVKRDDDLLRDRRVLKVRIRSFVRFDVHRAVPVKTRENPWPPTATRGHPRPPAASSWLSLNTVWGTAPDSVIAITPSKSKHCLGLGGGGGGAGTTGPLRTPQGHGSSVRRPIGSTDRSWRHRRRLAAPARTTGRCQD